MGEAGQTERAAQRIASGDEAVAAGDKAQKYTLEQAKKIAAENEARILGPNPASKRATFLGDDANTLVAASNVKPLDGYYDVFIHGSPDGQTFYIIENHYGTAVPTPYTPNEVADMIKAAGYEGGPIRLMSCSSGKVVGDVGPLPAPAAAKLSQILDTPVVAPQCKIVIAPDGRVGIDPNIVPPGKTWIEFGKDRTP